MSRPTVARQAASPRGVQSVVRVFGLLELLSEADDGMTITELAQRSDLPVPTVHRLLRTSINLGYVRQHLSRRYALGPRLIRLGEQAQGQLGALARPALTALALGLGETANLGVLDRDAVVYIAQSPSPHSMRMFTEVGRRVGLHATGVGKAILACLSDTTIESIIRRTGMPTPTPHSHHTLAALLHDVRLIRRRGYAVDDQEQELGVRCYAVLIPDAPVPMAVSVSGPLIRIDERFGDRAVRLLTEQARRISDELVGQQTHDAVPAGVDD